MKQRELAHPPALNNLISESAQVVSNCLGQIYIRPTHLHLISQANYPFASLILVELQVLAELD